MLLIAFGLAVLTANYGMALTVSKSNLTLPMPHIVIVGPTGAGKSSLANALIGEDVMCSDCLFPVCHDSDSCTKQTGYAAAHYLNNSLNQMFTVVDTPGFGDSDDEMEELLDEMIDVLNEDVKNASVILLTLDASETRFTDGLTRMLKQLESMFGVNMWNNTMIEMSKFSYEQDEIDDRKKECEEYPDDCHDEDYYKKEMNKQLDKRFHIGFELPVCFIDSWAQKGSNKEDITQQEYFLRETDKLWEYAITAKEFQFKTVDEVLEENAELRDEIDWLNDVITKNISELQERADYAEERIDENANGLIQLDDQLENMIGDVNDELQAEIKDVDEKTNTRLDTLNNSMAALAKDIDEDITAVYDALEDIGTMPLGSIIAWVPKPNEDTDEGVTFPLGWVRCDGNTISEPSIWAGGVTPNLHGYFLRGAEDDASTLKFQDDTFQDHTHTYTDKYPENGDCNGAAVQNVDGPKNNDQENDRWDCPHATTTGSTGSSETRPKNMAVTWIMRVW